MTLNPVTDNGSSSYLIGVDTGGTYTDAAIIATPGHRVLASAKAITTKADLAIGVVQAVRNAINQLSGTFSTTSISMVSISTTLATNAVVEGHGSTIAVILIGFDANMVARTGIAAAFPGMAIHAIDGGHDHNGDARAPLDIEGLDRALDAVADKVDAFAVASTFAVRNAQHELAAREHIIARTGKPVTLSTELSSSLDAPRRALTAALNARLISRITGLIDAVTRAMRDLNIDCPLMIVKGDGTLALAQSVAQRPIETVLSGPAASLVGAQWLSGLDNFILSDMGGTTTDLGIMQNGQPLVNVDGAEVGGWRTMVRAIDVRTLGLGGDSEVELGSALRVLIKPHRIVPVSLLGDRYPEVLPMLEADLADVDGANSLHGRFVLLPFGARSAQTSLQLSEREQAVLNLVTTYPQPLRKIANSLPAQRAVASLKRKGLVQVSGFTPSDAAHVLGMQENWNRPSAYIAAQLMCRLRAMKYPTPELTQQFAQDVWNETVRLSAHAVLDTAFGQNVTNDTLINAVCSGQGRLGLVKLSMVPSVPIVAVGGPVRVYYEEVARRLGCDVVFAPFCDVANAVGAATGVVSKTVVVRVNGDGSGVFRLLSDVGSQQFTDATAAIEAALQLASQTAHQAVLTMGATEPQIQTGVSKKWLPNARGDSGLLEAVITAQAMGRPKYQSQH